MASLTAEEKVEFLLSLLSDSEFSPNYQATMVKCGINTTGNTQRRLKGIVEADKKFRLESKGGTTRIVDLRSSTKSTQRVNVARSARGKKRVKRTEEGGDAEEKEQPVTKARKNKAAEGAEGYGNNNEVDSMYTN